MAIETPRGRLVAALCATGRPVYAINPVAVARYRDRHTVARSKSDHSDAVVLANILRTDAHVHRTLPDDTDLARAIAVLARAHQDATWRRINASNELRSTLREYYPASLDVFTHRQDFLVSADARVVLAIAPTPAAASKLTKTRIAAALRRERSQGRSPPDLGLYLTATEIGGLEPLPALRRRPGPRRPNESHTGAEGSHHESLAGTVMGLSSMYRKRDANENVPARPVAELSGR